MIEIRVGIDYSLSSPSVAFQFGDAVGFHDTTFAFLTSVKKRVGQQSLPNITGYEFADWSAAEQRYDGISAFVIRQFESAACRFASEERVFKVWFEGYSMGSKGRVFDIAENTGVLKHKLFELRNHFNIKVMESIPPSEVKKGFHGKGNADKEDMIDALCQRENIDLFREFDIARPIRTEVTVTSKKTGKTKVKIKKSGGNLSPISDITDSFAVVTVGRERS